MHPLGKTRSLGSGAEILQGGVDRVLLGVFPETSTFSNFLLHFNNMLGLYTSKCTFGAALTADTIFPLVLQSKEQQADIILWCLRTTFTDIFSLIRGY